MRQSRGDVFALDGIPRKARAGDYRRLGGHLVKVLSDDENVKVGKDGTVRIDGSAVTLDLSLELDKARTKRIPFWSGFDVLLPRDLRRLRSVWIAHWEPWVAAKLALLDPERASLTVTNPGNAPDLLDSLPRGLRALRLENGPEAPAEDLSSLRRLRDLEVLELVSSRPIDARWLKNLSGLRCLSMLPYFGLVYGEALGSLRGLRSLFVYSPDADLDLSFLGALEHLRWLSVDGCPSVDLSSLSRTSELRYMSACHTRLTGLESVTLPELRELDLSWTLLDEDALAAFSARHPACSIKRLTRQSVLAARAARATHVRVRTGGLSRGRHEPPPKTIFKKKGPNAVRAFLDLVEIDEEQSGGQILMHGGPTIELRTKERLVVAVSLVGGMLRSRVWPDDSEVTARSWKKLEAWLARGGKRR
jgi:hypothetical protein